MYIILFFHIYQKKIVMKIVKKSKSWEYYTNIVFSYDSYYVRRTIK